MVTRDDYTTFFESRRPNVVRPWDNAGRGKSWSRFWSSYLASASRIRRITANEAWDYVVPFRWLHGSTILGPQGTDAKADVLLYPSAITVIIRVDVCGRWPLRNFAAAVAETREQRNWSRQAGNRLRNRSLDGIATDLCNEAASAFLDADVRDPGSRTSFTIAAPTTGTGRLDSYALDSQTTKSCLAGLAVLAGSGKYAETHLLEQNSNPRRRARIYVLRDGHAIWHPPGFLKATGSDGIQCLHHNHTDLVAHIAALATIASWAADQIAARNPIPIAVQPLIHRAALRLGQLHGGMPERTYRSGVAKQRIEPLLPLLVAIKGAL